MIEKAHAVHAGIDPPGLGLDVVAARARVASVRIKKEIKQSKGSTSSVIFPVVNPPSDEALAQIIIGMVERQRLRQHRSDEREDAA